jgi:hypothetical protein
MPERPFFGHRVARLLGLRPYDPAQVLRVLLCFAVAGIGSIATLRATNASSHPGSLTATACSVMLSLKPNGSLSSKCADERAFAHRKARRR